MKRLPQYFLIQCSICAPFIFQFLIFIIENNIFRPVNFQTIFKFSIGNNVDCKSKSCSKFDVESDVPLFEKIEMSTFARSGVKSKA